MRNERVLEMTTIAMFGAIIAVMSFVPWLGYITVGVAAITLIHIPVLIGGIIGGRRVAITLGFIFGALSMMRAFITPDGANVFFQNPLISILPRVLFGVIVWYLYIALKNALGNLKGENSVSTFLKKDITILGITFGLSTLAHTVITLIALYLFAFEGQWAIFGGEGALPFIWGIMLSNGFIEIGIAIVIGAPIAWRIKDFYDHDINVETQE